MAGLKLPEMRKRHNDPLYNNDGLKKTAHVTTVVVEDGPGDSVPDEVTGGVVSNNGGETMDFEHGVEVDTSTSRSTERVAAVSRQDRVDPVDSPFVDEGIGDSESLEYTVDTETLKSKMASRRHRVDTVDSAVVDEALGDSESLDYTVDTETLKSKMASRRHGVETVDSAVVDEALGDSESLDYTVDTETLKSKMGSRRQRVDTVDSAVVDEGISESVWQSLDYSDMLQSAIASCNELHEIYDASMESLRMYAMNSILENPLSTIEKDGGGFPLGDFGNGELLWTWYTVVILALVSVWRRTCSISRRSNAAEIVATNQLEQLKRIKEERSKQHKRTALLLCGQGQSSEYDTNRIIRMTEEAQMQVQSLVQFIWTEVFI